MEAASPRRRYRQLDKRASIAVRMETTAAAQVVLRWRVWRRDAFCVSHHLHPMHARSDCVLRSQRA
eukprot:6214609-Pleurochrysis_carterae.AAC.2